MKKLRLGVTGLRRAGKTVFLTSLINHLLEGSEDTLRIFRDEGVIFSGKERLGNPKVTKFPYYTYLDGFRHEKPRWPEQTFDVAEFQVELTIRRRKTRKMVLQLVDYPGERLLDIPLTHMRFETWSGEVIRDAQVGMRKALSRDWLAKIEEIKDGGESAARAYADYLRVCREEGLTFLQPSGMLLDETEGLDLRFCPLPEGARESAPEVAAEFKARYRNYVREYVKPFHKKIARCARQIVLVDVLEVLRRGVDSYNDARKCLRSVLDAYRYAKDRWRFSPLTVLDRPTKIDRVIFLATKADQCSRASRGNLRRLLAELTRPKHRELKATLPREGGRLRFDFCAAHQCTDDCDKKFPDGETRSCLTGYRQDWPPERPGTWTPGDVPEEWPDDEWDPEKMAFRFPAVLPRRLPRRDGAVIDHINLDKVFLHILEDKIR